MFNIIPTKKNFADEPPLRSDLFNATQMEHHAKVLAKSHALTTRCASNQLLARLTENKQILLEVCHLLIDAIQSHHRIAPAGEWLLDNFYLIEEQVRTAKLHLPKGYIRQLPHLRNGPSSELPRVYDIALEIISHGDGRVDLECLAQFIASYQTVTVLKLGELWAIPIMLQLTLIENLRRLASRITVCRNDQNLADKWADRMSAMAETDPKNIVLVIADMARSNPPTSSAFVAELVRRLQGQSAALVMPLTWLEQYLVESGLAIEQLINAENQQQSTDQASIRHTVMSLRLLESVDWRNFVEDMSVVEHTLREDPGKTYTKMDFPTRDSYRHIVEKIAKNSTLSEVEVARLAIQLAGESATKENRNERELHVGFFLIGKGVTELERMALSRLSVLDSLQRSAHKLSSLLYFGTIASLVGIFTIGFLAKAYADGLHIGLLFPMCILALLGASHVAIAITNWLATILATPSLLPRLDFSKGISSDAQTLVVVPTIITSTQNIKSLVESLEVCFLANRDDCLRFGLLTDFCDAAQEFLPSDQELLRFAEQEINALNEKYPRTSSAVTTGSTFCLFHRPRLWNEQEQVWMGYERKRGKLAELNALLRGRSNGGFSLVVGDTNLSKIIYVITLDTDTKLPRDAAKALVGAMAHPLNRARYDEAKQRVCEGYGILQPRISGSLHGANRSRYALLYGEESGIDPYTHSVSDVYQDWFQEGSFIGKGIYDVDIFEQALKGRFANNQILSHDLLEGCYARSGFISDVQLFEEYPKCYSADVNRRYRWIRGDWQIAQWILPHLMPNGLRHKNPLSKLSRWKLFDNLRRSLVPTALTLMLVVNWVLLSSAWFSTFAVLSIITLPYVMNSLRDAIKKKKDVLWSHHLSASAKTTRRQLAQAMLAISLLPYEAFFSLEATLRTIWRMQVSHKNLLEWASSCGANNKSPDIITLVGPYFFFKLVGPYFFYTGLHW